LNNEVVIYFTVVIKNTCTCILLKVTYITPWLIIMIHFIQLHEVYADYMYRYL